MNSALLHEDQFLQILWDQQTRIMSIDWKAATSGMTDGDFKTELALFTKHVEDKRAPRVLIDVSKFGYRPSEEVGEWRRKNIVGRYNDAGVKRFAFLFSKGEAVPSMENQSEGEAFLTQSFNRQEQAAAWLIAGE